MVSGQRALISVSNKQGIVELARELVRLQITILSTSGTGKLLADAGIPCLDISEYTGFPEILGGRVKTLHPAIHGGILARRDAASEAELQKYHVQPIDLVIVNLYPFAETVASHQTTLSEAIEQIDIGGVALVRAAAKNFSSVTVIVDPADYPLLLHYLQKQGAVPEEIRLQLAQKAFTHTALYDQQIASYLCHQQPDEPPFPDTLMLSFQKVQDLRYGENPHQQAAVYRTLHTRELSIVQAEQLHGKELSFNNIVDLDATLALLQEFSDRPTATIIKHTNPCGVGQGETLHEAYCRAREADPLSAFGGIVGLNQVVDLDTAREIGATFIEVILAPGFTDEALDRLRRKPNLRLLALPHWHRLVNHAWEMRGITGGILLQERDTTREDPSIFRVVTDRPPTEEEYQTLLFAWKVVKHVKSNAIVLARYGQTVGIGAGQMSRVDAVQIACLKAVLPTQGTVMASDAFFPFRDGIDKAAASGVTAVIQPGGSRRDAEVIQAANEHGMTMLFTGRRHFKH